MHKRVREAHKEIEAEVTPQVQAEVKLDSRGRGKAHKWVGAEVILYA